MMLIEVAVAPSGVKGVTTVGCKWSLGVENCKEALSPGRYLDSA